MSSTYNCVGMVFASRRTWVDPATLPMIFADDGYNRIEAKEVEPGDVLVYKDDRDRPVHIGIVIEHVPDVSTASWKTRLLSQWGGDGEYFHDADDVTPLLGKPEEFWSERI